MSDNKKNPNVFSFSGIETKVETKQSFKPDATINKGLCIGKLVGIRIDKNEISKFNGDGTPSGWDMAGYTSPNLILTFKQVNNNNKDTAERILELRETVISTKKSNGESIAAKVWYDLIANMFKRLQHIVNAFDDAKLQPLSSEKDLRKLPDFDYNDSVEVRIEKFTKFFEHFYKQISGISKEGDTFKFNDIPCWMRVVASPSRDYYMLPSYVGKGFIEVVKAGVSPVIEIAINDELELVKKDKSGKSPMKDLNKKDVDADSPVQGENASEVLKNLGIN